MRAKTSRVFVCDSETTVFEGQNSTEVWASCCCELWSEDARVFHSLGEQLEFFYSLESNLIIYYHNLKFDGAFLLNYLYTDIGYKLGGEPEYGEKGELISFNWKTVRALKNGEFIYHISDLGQWYKIIIKMNGKILEFRDSVKLIPFSVAEIGKSFNTKHRKLNMEYKGYRYAGCPISPEEEEYIKNDVYVVKEGLEQMFTEGHNRLTIGSCCLHEYKKLLGRKCFDEYFVNLAEIPLEESYGSNNADAYVRKSYKGAWCYLVKGKENRVFKNGLTLDVNSLYPSVMHSESLNVYPIGRPYFWKGNYIPDEAKERYYFIRVKTRFYIKPGKLPCIQVKNDLRYKINEQLTTSDVMDPKSGKYYSETVGKNGTLQGTRLELTWTMTDYQLIKEHYDLVDFEILDGCYFSTALGIFDTYINKYREIKENSEGGRRTVAKLYLNNLYGKMATNPKSYYKLGYIKEDGSMGFIIMKDEPKKPVYIPVGSAITSYARAFTIRAAQENFYGENEPGFIYADTDSLHLDLPLNEIKGVKISDNRFNCWKNEGSWSEGLYIRQKTYIEHKGEGYSITCAGMPQRCKDKFIELLESKEKSITDFKQGLKIAGKLLPVRIPGGIILKETTFEIR